MASMHQLFHQTSTDSANEEEGHIVAQLSWDLMDQTPTEDLFMFLVTEDSTRVAGCIMFSRLKFLQQTNIISFLLAPVAVRTTHQKRGIGTICWNKREPNTDLLVSYGDPNYYSKVGFQPVTTAVIPAPLPLSMPQGWLALPLFVPNGYSIDTENELLCHGIEQEGALVRTTPKEDQ